MKVGILTFHRALNYGAVLQCYALMKKIEKLGHDAYVVDYRQPHIERQRKLLCFNNGIKSSVKRLLRIKRKYLFRLSFDVFLNKYFKVIGLNRDLDCYVIGSDQVWGKHCLGGRFDDVYLGDFEHTETSKIIGYAVSTNVESLNSMDNNLLKGACDNFSNLSFREKAIADIVKGRTQKNVNEVVDPTLLLGEEEWNEIVDDSFKNRNYIFLYEARINFNDSGYLYRKANEFAQQLNCEVIRPDYRTSPEQFVSLVKYAKCVVTSSFHAVAFSLIFQKELYAARLGDGHDDRYISLLTKIGAESFVVSSDFSLRINGVSYDDIKTHLKSLSMESELYLKSCLS